MDEIAKFYPTVWKPNLVVEADFKEGYTVYRISRYAGFEIAKFSISDTGERKELRRIK